MAKQSAGLLLYRRSSHRLEVFLVHPGGPWWVRKDLGVWSIPKGEYTEGEDPLAAARREFTEETGFTAQGCFIPLEAVRQSGGKIVKAWALESDCDATAVRSGSFSMEWPPRSGKLQDFPEVDRAAWFDIETAREKLLRGQLPLLDELASLVSPPMRNQETE